LNGKWEVALVDVRYPSYISIPTQNVITYFIAKPDSEPSPIRYYIYNYKVKDIEKEGFLDLLATDFNRWASKKGKEQAIQFHIDSNNIVHIVNPGESRYGKEQYIYLPVYLARAFNFSKDLFVFNNRVLVSDTLNGLDSYAGLMARESLQIYIYMNILRQQIVGDTMAPLLRCSTLKNGSNIKEFNQLLYKPIEQNYIETIEVNIRDEMGEFILFDKETLSVTLHFKNVP